MNRIPDRKPNFTYAYGMLVLGMVCVLGGILSVKVSTTFNPYGLGVIFLGLFLVIQYLKAMGKVPERIIRLLTWIVVFGFLFVDILLMIQILR